MSTPAVPARHTVQFAEEVDGELKNPVAEAAVAAAEDEEEEEEEGEDVASQSTYGTTAAGDSVLPESDGDDETAGADDMDGAPRRVAETRDPSHAPRDTQPLETSAVADVNPNSAVADAAEAAEADGDAGGPSHIGNICWMFGNFG